MLARIRKFFQTPTINNIEAGLRADYFKKILLAIFVLTIFFFLYAIFFPPKSQLSIAAIALLVEIILWILFRNQKIRLAGIILSSFIWSAILFEVITYGGIRDSGFASFIIVIVIAELTIGSWGGFVFGLLTIIAGLGLIVAESAGYLPPYATVSNFSILISHIITIVFVLLLLNLIIQNVNRISRKSERDAILAKEKHDQLAESQQELNKISDDLSYQNKRLEIINKISESPKIFLSENDYLNKIAQLLGNLYLNELIQVFILSESEEYAILQSSNREHFDEQQIPVFQSESRYGIALENTLDYQVGNKKYRLEAPATKDLYAISISFPIETEERLIGLLNIQTLKALNAPDIDLLKTIVNHMAIVLEKMKLYKQLQQTSHEIEQLNARSTQMAWESIETGKMLGYQYDRVQMLPANENYPQDVITQLLAGKSVSYVTKGKNPTSRLVTPIILRNQVIGVIGYEEKELGHIWESDRIIILETVASQVGMALENTRLIAEAQHRAQQEKLISDVSSHIRETLDIETILQTTVQELQRSFKLSDAEIRLQSAKTVSSGDEE